MAWTFLIITIMVYNSIVIFMPKRRSKLEMWTTSLFALVLDWTIDGILDLKLDLYGYFNKGVDYGGVVAVFGIYPAITMIFLNFYPFKKGKWARTLYITCWTVYALIYEELAVKSGMFYHNGWQTWYSALINPVLFLILVWHLNFIRKLIQQNKNSNNMVSHNEA